MAIKDVEVIVTRETAALSQAGFGMPFILATHDDVEYGEYTGIDEVADDYDVNTEAYKIAARIFGQSPRPPIIAMAGSLYTDDESTLVSFLNELIEIKNDWYFLLSDQNGAGVVGALSAWVDTQNKLYFVTTDDLDLPQQLESENTIVMYHSDPKQFSASGWVGCCAPELPGSITWKFKTINGVSESEIRTGDLNQLHEDGGNSYIRKYGILQSTEGLTTSGEYIDVMRSQHFLEARLAEQVSRLFMTSKKVPYDNSGIALIVAECESVLKLATTQGIIALDDDGNGMWSINAPKREDIPTNDIANRKLDNVNIEITLAGAVHQATLRVTLKY